MPSPFPGMDPYLEEPGLWPDVHHELISVARELLNAQIAPKYFARIEERVYISDDEDPGRKLIVPDLRIALTGKHRRHHHQNGGVAVAEPIVMTTLIDEEIHESRIEIRERSTKDVVCVIEILSPANKLSGSAGHASYRKKRHEILNSDTHLIEIDLLRKGVRTVPSPKQAHDYVAHVSRVERRPRGEVWPIQLRQRLPVIPVPLRRPDEDAKLDLQQTLATVYERARYEVELDYSRDAVPPLEKKDKSWAQAVLAKAGMR